MRLSGYKGPLRAVKASKKQLKDIIFPEIMTYILDFLLKNPDIFTKPFLTRGPERGTEVLSIKAFEEIKDFKLIEKLTLHDFLTGKQLVKLIIKRHKEAGFAQQEDEA